MKRFINITVVIAFLAVGFLSFSPMPSASAVNPSSDGGTSPPTAAEKRRAEKCYQDFHNETVTEGKPQYQALVGTSVRTIETACANRTTGNCTLNELNGDGDIRDGDSPDGNATQFKVKCTREYGSNEAFYINESDQIRDNVSGSGDANSPSINQIKDPALKESARCDRDRCELIAKYVNPLITLLTVLVGIAVVIGIIWGGIQIATSSGDPQKTAAGKGHIQNAVIAIIAYLILFAGLQWLLPGGFL